MSSLSLTSNLFADGGDIPAAQGCTNKGGDNRSPSLFWSNAPAGTISFALIMDDEGCGSGDLACKHWAVYNIPANVTKLDAAQDVSRLNSATQGTNYLGEIGYAGPCPPERHTYRFAVYALKDGMPAIESGTALTRSQFEKAYGEYVLDRAILAGIFPPR